LAPNPTTAQPAAEAAQDPHGHSWPEWTSPRSPSNKPRRWPSEPDLPPGSSRPTCWTCRPHRRRDGSPRLHQRGRRSRQGHPQLDCDDQNARVLDHTKGDTRGPHLPACPRQHPDSCTSPTQDHLPSPAPPGRAMPAPRGRPHPPTDHATEEHDHPYTYCRVAPARCHAGAPSEPGERAFPAPRLRQAPRALRVLAPASL
jgi:hypothetical protein